MSSGRDWTDTGAPRRSDPPHRSSYSDDQRYGTGGWPTEQWSGYANDRHRSSGQHSGSVVPLVSAAVGAVLGYMLPALVSASQPRSNQRTAYGMRGSGMGRSSQSGMSTSRSVEMDETTEMIASNKVEGTKVYNHAGEHLGEVYNFMVGKRSGRVAYAVMSFGGFLGIGQRYHALPWNVLTYDTGKGGYVISATKDRLMNAPNFAAGEEPFSQPSHMKSIREYWADGQLSL
jgi:sporulation protein YlmC with PRC-barrel domain